MITVNRLKTVDNICWHSFTGKNQFKKIIFFKNSYLGYSSFANITIINTKSIT